MYVRAIAGRGRTSALICGALWRFVVARCTRMTQAMSRCFALRGATCAFGPHVKQLQNSYHAAGPQALPASCDTTTIRTGALPSCAEPPSQRSPVCTPLGRASNRARHPGSRQTYPTQSHPDLVPHAATRHLAPQTASQVQPMQQQYCCSTPAQASSQPHRPQRQQEQMQLPSHPAPTLPQQQQRPPAQQPISQEPLQPPPETLVASAARAAARAAARCQRSPPECDVLECLPVLPVVMDMHACLAPSTVAAASWTTGAAADAKDALQRIKHTCACMGACPDKSPLAGAQPRKLQLTNHM